MDIGDAARAGPVHGCGATARAPGPIPAHVVESSALARTLHDAN